MLFSIKFFAKNFFAPETAISDEEAILDVFIPLKVSFVPSKSGEEKFPSSLTFEKEDIPTPFTRGKALFCLK